MSVVYAQLAHTRFCQVKAVALIASQLSSAQRERERERERVLVPTPLRTTQRAEYRLPCVSGV